MRGESLPGANESHRYLHIPVRNVVAIGNQLESSTFARCDQLHLLPALKFLVRRTQRRLRRVRDRDLAKLLPVEALQLLQPIPHLRQLTFLGCGLIVQDKNR